MTQLNLRVTLNSNGSITANWDPIPDLIRYEVRMHSPGEDYMIVYEKNIMVTSYTSQPDIEANKKYKVVVIGYSNSQQTVSEGVTVLIPSDFYDNTPLAVPQNVSAKADTISVTVSFSKVVRATSYDILFDGTVYNTTSTSKKISGLQPKSSHTYAVRAKNSAQTGEYSTLQAITTLPQTPAVPSGITKAVTETTVTIGWNAVNLATNYDIIFNGTVYNTTATSKTFTGLTSAKAYSFKIRAKSADAISEYTSEFTVTTAPIAPTGVMATATEDTVTINWNKVTGATGYKVCFNGTDYMKTETECTFEKLYPDTAYTYQVCSKGSDGCSSYSTAKTIKTLKKPVVAPGNITKTSTENSFTVSWDAVEGATGYDVLFNNTVYGTTSTSKTFTGLTENTIYTYQVRSKNADGVGAYSAAQTVKTTPKTLQSTNVSANGNSVTISWDAVSGATSYDILFNGNVYHVTGTSKTFTGLTENTTYTYQIRVNNADGSSSYSEVKTVVTIPDPPGVPTNISATATTTTVTIKWNAVSGATAYNVLINGKTYRVSGTSLTVTGLASGKKYTYYVRANNAGGTGAYSAAKTVTTLVAVPPVPTNVTATATSTTVTVQWNKVSGATGYDLIFAGKSYSVTGTSKTFTGLTPKANYSYQVRAKNSAGNSAYTTLNTVTTLAELPVIPTNISATATEESVTVSWNKVSGATGYNVLFNGTVYQTTNTSVTISDLTPGTNYGYAVQAVNESGTSAYSSTMTVRTVQVVPETPINVKATVTENSIFLSWPVVQRATEYDILFNENVYSTENNTKTFTGLLPNTDYTYAVRAKNDAGVSAYSEMVTVTTPIALPDTPTNVTATSTLNSVTVSWDSVDGATDYDVKFDDEVYTVAGSASTFSLLRSTIQPVGANSKTFSGFKPNTKHTYCVRANNEGGSSDYSTLQTITTKTRKTSGLPSVKSCKTYPDGKRAYTGLDPVNALTGAFMWSHTCLMDYGKDALHFTAMYDSRRNESTKVLGKKWTYSLNYLLLMDDEYAYFCTPYDEVIPFVIDKEADSFVQAEGAQSNYVMGKGENQTYFVRDIDGTEYIFDSNLCLNQIVENGLVTYQLSTDEEGKITQIEGRYSGKLLLTYENGHISEVADAMGNTVTFSYEGECLTAITNQVGNSMTFTYDEFDNLLEITDFSGEIYLTNQYDNYGRVTAQHTAGRGDSFAFYNEADGITIFTDELGNQTTYYYDENLRVTDVDIAESNVQNKYNADGRLTEQVDALGNSTKMAYDECGRMNHVTYPDGSVEQIVYNNRNYPVQIINRDGTESRFEYDERNNLIAATDERGNTCYYAYDDADNLISYTDKRGYVWKYTYDEYHHLKQAEDPEGNTDQYIHDLLGRMVVYTSPIGRMTSYSYSKEGNLLQVENVAGKLSIEYDENGNPIGVTDKMGNKQRLEYNEMGQPLSVTDFRGNEYRFTYDEKGNLISETDPLGYSQSYEYDALGNCTEQTDKNGGATTYSFNAASQLTEVRNAEGNMIQYAYDTMGRVTAVTDALNHQTGYTYDAMGRLTSVTNALGDSVSYTYDEVGNLLTKTDENGAVITYAYDKENRLSSVKTDNGTIYFIYDKAGRVTAVQDPEGYQETVTYDANGNIARHYDKEDNQTTYVYDSEGRLTEEISDDGYKTWYSYDKNGNCIKITNAEHSEYVYEYDADNRLTKEVNPLGYETLYEYNERGELKTVTDPGGGKTTFEYDGNGNCIRKTNPLGGEEAYVYDSLNRLTEYIDEEGNKQTFTYDANGNRTSYTDANLNKWEYEYDAVNRLTGVTDQNGGQLTLEYTKTGKIAKVTDQEGAETNYTYDSMGQLVEMSDSLENSMHFSYDSLGRVIAQTDANGNTTEYEYSPVGNLICVKDAEDNVTSYTYNACGQILTETNALGNVNSYEYDILGRTIAITDALGGRTSFTYTADSKIASVTDANGNTTEYQYDVCGNLTQITDAMGNVTAYEYDAMNNRIKECVSASGEQSCVTLYQYDKKGRVVKEINPLADEKEYSYDANGNIVTILDEETKETTISYDLNNRPVNMCYSDGREATFRYNKRGELVELKDWNGVVAMEYGKTGKLTKVTDHNGRVTGYGYDANGNIASITYPDGSTVNYTFDKNNRMTKVVDEEDKAAQYVYDAVGNVTSLTQPGSVSSYAYNAKGMPISAKYQFDDGTTTKSYFSYDATGKLVRTVREGNTPVLAGQTDYTYDALGRLLSYKDGQVTEAYAYDGLGNRIAKSVNGIPKASYQYNARNQLTERVENGICYSYGYDPCGNLTEEKRGDDIIRTYLYDATGHLSMGKDLETGEKTEYGYNALYMRVKNVKTLQNRPGRYQSCTSGSEGKIPFITKETSYVTDYLSSANNELMAYESGYGEVRTVFGQGYLRLGQKVTFQPEIQASPVASIAASGNGKAYFQPDIQGSLLFAANEQGEVLLCGERHAWGDVKFPMQDDMNVSALEENLRYTSYSYDPVIEKYFAHARMYDSRQGRMLSPDPVRRNPNGYPYCENDPVNYVDPTGEVANVLAGGLIGGLTGGVFGFAGSAISQLVSGEKFDVKKALGSAANGAIVGAVKGALIGSGAGIGLSLVSDFAAGTAGSAIEQKISTGNVSVSKSLAGGFSNAVSGAIYGNSPLKSVKQAFRKGAASGAATSGINYLADTLGNKNSSGSSSQAGKYVITKTSPYAIHNDPRSGCGVSNPLSNTLGYSTAYGYQYTTPQTESDNKQNNFSLAEFGKAMLVGGLTGGFAGASFYGAGKAVEAVKGSVRNAGGNLSSSESQVIQNRYSNESQAGWEVGYTIENKRIHVDNGVQNVDFVIDMNGKLHIGSGHSYLANGADVQAAGTLKINNQGYVRNITNASGHYAPTVKQGREFPNMLNRLGIRTQNAWLELGDYSFTPSGYVDVTHSSMIVEQLK